MKTLNYENLLLVIVLPHFDHGASYAANVWDIYWFEKNLQGDIIAVYDQAGNKLIAYKYDAWGNTTINYYNSGDSTTAVNNPFRYRGYYYDQDLKLYYLNTRYYDSNTGRFISPDTEAVITATPDALTDKNLYAYCDNNPIMRRDDGGEWWVFANAVVGAVVGAVSKFVSNVVTGEEWNEGVVGAAVGGATYGVVLATTGNIALAGYSSAAAESLTNETLSYIPALSNLNGTETQQLTKENVRSSLTSVIRDTVVNGTLNTITGKVASKIVPTNNVWFTPKKLTSSFMGNYAKKAHLQTVIQGIETIGINCFHYQGMKSFR